MPRFLSSPEPVRPSFSLEPRMQLARVVQKNQNAYSVEIGLIEHAASGRLKPSAHDGKVYEGQEAGGDIGAMMREVVPVACGAIELPPRLRQVHAHARISFMFIVNHILG